MTRAGSFAWPAAGAVAAKKPLSEFGKRRFAVPMETVLFVRYADGRQQVLTAGETVDTREPGVGLLARTTRIEIPFEFDELSAADEHWIDASVRLAVRVVPKASDLASLLDRAVGAAGDLTPAVLRDLLETPCRASLCGYCETRPAKALTAGDHTREVETAVRAALARATFTYGLEFLGLDQLRLTSRRKGRPKRIILERTRQFLIASGRQVLVFDPGSCAEPSAAYEVSGALGALRSVRAVWVGSERYVAGGARDGVYLCPAGSAGPALEYPLPHATRGRSGVNAATVHRGSLFATHSEHGLTVWSLDQPGVAGTPLLPALTEGASHCRQVQVVAGDAAGGAKAALLFTAGSNAVSVDLTSAGAAPVVFRGTGSDLSALTADAAHVYAGTSRGEVLRWRRDAPDAAAEQLLRKGHAIYGLALVYLDALPHLLVGAKDYAVLALKLDDQTETLFRSPRWPVGFVAGASDFVAGVDADRATVLVWETASPARPAHTLAIRSLTGHSVQDLAAWTEPAPARELSR